MTIATATLLGCAAAGSASSGRSLVLAAAEQLDVCAHALRDAGEQSQAAAMAEGARRLRDVEAQQREAEGAARQGRPYQTNFYMGVVPDAALAACAEDLRTLGKLAEAQRADAMALAYCQEQVRVITAQLQGQRTFSGRCPNRMKAWLDPEKGQ